MVRAGGYGDDSVAWCVYLCIGTWTPYRQTNLASIEKMAEIRNWKEERRRQKMAFN